MRNEFYKIEEVKVHIINNSLLLASVIGSLAYLTSLNRLWHSGFHISFLINFIIVAMLLVMTWFRARISMVIKTYMLIGLLVLISLIDSLNFGLLSTTRVYLILIPLFSIVSLSFRRTILIVILTILCFLTIGCLHYIGVLSIPQSYNPAEYTQELFPWIIIAIHLLLVASVILLVTRRFIAAYSGFIETLETTIKNRTADLEATNEELAATNEELLNHREALQKALFNLEETQNQLIHSEKMASLGILAAGVAHEINNPLNFINGGAIGIENYIREHLNEHAEDLTPFIEGIQVGIQRASDIVTSLNQYSRYNDSLSTPCDIHVIIENCLVMIHNQLKDKVEIHKQFTEKNCNFVGNEGKLHQAFLNILINASQSIEDKGMILIQTTILKSNLIITFTDNGIGIKKVDLHRITDPFFTTKEAGKGTGLGLWITYNIIKEHHGTLTFKSKPGSGTKVIITLPLITAEANGE